MTKVDTLDNLSKRSIRALKWNYLGSGINISSQFLIGIVLARLLNPEDFGVVAIAWLMISIGKLISDFGFNAALVQKSNVTEQDLRFVFTIQLTLGIILTSVGFYFANHLAIFFNNLNAKPVIQAMAMIFLIQPFGQTASAMMARNLAFKSNQIIRIISYLVGYILVGIPLAYSGFGPWSLVGAQLVQSLLFSLLAIYFYNVPIKPALKPSSTGLFIFGSKVIGTNLVNWSISNLDSFVVGHSLAVSDLGLYNRAMAFVATPAGAVTASLQSVLLSACSRVQMDLDKIKKVYLAATAAIGFICLPVFLTVAIVPETIVLALYGEKWAQVVPILTPLALAVSVNGLLAIVGPVLTAINKVQVELYTQVVTLLFMVPILYLTAQYSLEVLAWGVLAISIFRWFLLVRYLIRLINMNWMELFNTMFWPFLCGSFTALSTLGVDSLTVSLNTWLRLFLDMLSALIAILVITRLFGQYIYKGPYSDFLNEDGRMPPFVRNWLRV